MAPIIRSPALATERRTPGPSAGLPVVPAAIDAPDQARAIEEAEAEAAAMRISMLEEARLSAAAAEAAAQQVRLDQARQAEAELREQAYREAYALGSEAARQEYAQSQQHLATLLTQFELRMAQAYADIEDSAVEIVFEALGMVLGAALQSREGVLAQVRQVLARIRNRDMLTVRLHPHDLALIDNGAAFGPAPAGAIQWLADESLSMGGCVLIGAEGELDARLDTQLAAFRRSLGQARAAALPSGAQS